MSDASDRPGETPDDLLVLHAVRCVGSAEVGRLADAAGLSESETESQLIDLAVEGLVAFRTGAFSGWGLTDAGRAVVAERIAEEVRSTGTRPVIASAYEAFLVLNPVLLELCTAWQTRMLGEGMVMNDHADAAYDAAVLARFIDLDRRVEIVLEPLTAAVGRFGRYRARFTEALARASAGAREELADSTSSYHVVWFQLHEDLLATLGLPRH